MATGTRIVDATTGTRIADDADVPPQTNGNFGAQNIVTSGTCAVGGLTCTSLRDTALSTGVLHSDNAGNVTSSLVVDADVSGSAAIAGSKINPNFGSQTLTAGSTTVNGFTNQGYGAGVVHAAFGGGTSSSPVVNADVSATAAIDGTKVSPNFGSQNVLTSGTLGAGATTLGNTTCGTLGATTCTLGATTASSVRSTNLSTGSVKSDNAGNLGILSKANITGALSNVTDTNAKNVMTSIIAALVAANIATDGTT